MIHKRQESANQSSGEKMDSFRKVLILLIGISGSAVAATIPDDPIIPWETGLESKIDDVSIPYWLDKDTILVSALVHSKSEFWNKKLMAVDVRTGKAETIFPEGAVHCVNTNEAVALVSIGSRERLIVGNSNAPVPMFVFSKWNAQSRKLMPYPSASDEGWDLENCTRNGLKDGRPVIHLSRNQYLVLDGSDAGDAVRLYRNGKEVGRLDVKPSEIPPVPKHIGYRDQYLLSPGEFFTDSTRIEVDGVMTQERPILTFNESAKVQRVFVRKEMLQSGFQSFQGITYPYAKGILIRAGGGPKNGGGLFLKTRSSIRRVWCVNEGNTYDRICNLGTVTVSPTGCHAAFFSSHSDDLKSPATSNDTLKILPLCK